MCAFPTPLSRRPKILVASRQYFGHLLMRISSHNNFFCPCNKGMSHLRKRQGLHVESAANLARRLYRSNPTVSWQNSTTYPYHFFSQRRPWAGFVQILQDADFELLTSCSNMYPFLYIMCSKCSYNRFSKSNLGPRTYFHAHILFHEWSAVAISIYIGCRQGDKAWWQSFSQLEHRGPKLNKYRAMFFPFKRCGVLITF